jgi:hypothetical protein
MTRPLLNWSSIANRRASITVGWNSASITLVPSLIRSVRAAT